jgi:RimJ/RimL family protein N-acetyltransferase
MMNFLNGTKIYLRPVEPNDATNLATWLNDWDVIKNLTKRFPMSREQEEEWIRGKKNQKDFVNLMICLKENDKSIGICGFDKIDYINRTATYGTFIGEKEDWNKGYGSEALSLLCDYAFNKLNLNKVKLKVYSFNKRGIKAYEKCGFKVTGVEPEEMFLDGKYHDAYIMCLLKRDWCKK